MVNDISSSFDTFIGALLKVLPLSPFQQYLQSLGAIDVQWIRWLNWFFPVGQCLTVMAAWLVAVGLYYAYSIIMRWVKVIGD